MKPLKKRLVHIAIVALIGIVFIVFGMLRGGDSPLFTFGMAYIIAAAIRFVQYYRLFKDEEKREAFEIAQSEERVVYIANKARSLMFVITIVVELLVAVMLFVMKQELLGQTLFYIVAVQTVGYWIIYYYYNKKH